MANLRWLAARRSVVLIAVSIFVLGAVAGSWTTARAGHLPFITKPVLVKISDTTGGAEDHEVSFASGWAGCILLVRIINLADAQHGVGFMALTNSLYPGLHFMHRWENLLGGATYGFVDGAIGGLLFAWIYDHLVGGTHATNHPA